MTSTLIAPTHDIALDGDQPCARPMLFDTMQAVIVCRRELRPVPERLVDELRARHLTSLVDAIERYNLRMSRVLLSA
jgi:hypothetical protein